MALLLLSSLVDSLGFQDKARVETFKGWLERLMYFDHMARVAENPEELKSIEEEKQIFLNEIGYDQNMLRHFMTTCFDFRDRIACQTTKEGIMSVLEEMDPIFYCGNKTSTMDLLVTALDKFILGKNKKKYYPCRLSSDVGFRDSPLSLTF